MPLMAALRIGSVLAVLALTIGPNAALAEDPEPPDRRSEF
jgi:hypothetical protein